MRNLVTSELLDIWDAGQRSPPMHCACLLLGKAYPGEPIECWSLGQVNAGLLAMRAQWFGNDWPCLATCPACGEVNELALRVDGLLEAANPTYTPAQASERVQVGDWLVVFRLPCAADLLELGRIAGSARWLLDRVVSEVTHAGTNGVAEDLPESALQLIGKQIEMADPMANIELSLSCPACSHGWNEPLHVIDVFWSELSALAERVLSEVGRLAQSFGWGESEILAMSPQRRQRYLTWLGT